ncbi:hypothetical protein NDU88_005148 [Pleurodeles waltl]|uniref:Uncharacterized protein n=1 Tax=Pleurodeles waltl TaxID=8319 RepID=A0AAV7WBW6_PLEWA|nr:hypothetical protein NDU88_005148 [Pleurodeles waltl]
MYVRSTRAHAHAKENCKRDPSPPWVLPNCKSGAYLLQRHSFPTEALSRSTASTYPLQSDSSPSESLNGSGPAERTANDPKRPRTNSPHSKTPQSMKQHLYTAGKQQQRVRRTQSSSHGPFGSPGNAAAALRYGW